jgi:hypothetical protein
VFLGVDEQMQVVAGVGVFVDFHPVFVRESVDQMLDPALVFWVEHRPGALGAGRTQGEVKGAPWVEGPVKFAAAPAQVAAVLSARIGFEGVMLKKGGLFGHEEYLVQK